MTASSNTFFALGADGAYYYSTPKRSRWNCVRSLLDTVDSNANSRILWGAFGPEQENYFFSWKTENGKVESATSTTTPAALKAWLKDHPVDEHVRVSLGPNDSFFIWDSQNIYWNNLPPGLQKSILGWLGPCGWKHGPPRIVALGAKGAYFALSEYGRAAWSIPSPAHPLNELVEDVHNGRLSWSDLEYLNLSPSDETQFLYFTKDHGVMDVEVPDREEVWYSCFEELLSPAEAKDFKQFVEQQKKAKENEARKKEKKARAAKEKAEREERERKEKERQRKAEEKARAAKEEQERKEEQARQEYYRQERERQEKAREEEERKRQERLKKEQERQRQEQREKEELVARYRLWRNRIDSDVEQKRVPTIFPHLPTSSCTCQLVACKARKTDRGLMACSHDVEKFLRASGSYNKNWLRNERLMWHPDRFGRRCDPDFRAELIRKATEMYAIFEVLIAKEPD